MHLARDEREMSDRRSRYPVQKSLELLVGLGKCYDAEKILVYPAGNESSAGSYRLYEMLRNKTNPKGIINLRADPVDATGASFCTIPMMDRLDGNPLELIKTGDYVELDADRGVVTVEALLYQKIQP